MYEIESIFLNHPVFYDKINNIMMTYCQVLYQHVPANTVQQCNDRGPPSSGRLPKTKPPQFVTAVQLGCRHHCMVQPHAVSATDDLQIRTVAANMIHKQLRIDEQGRCSIWGIGLDSHNTDPK